jgi:hypothetical protein
LGSIAVMNFQIKIEHLIKIKGINPRDCHAERVADEVPGMVVMEEGGVFRKDGALFGFLHIGLESHKAVFARLVEQVVHHLEGVNVGLFAELGSSENTGDSSHDFLDDVQRIRNQQCARGSTGDDEQLSRLQQHANIAVLHKVTGQDAAEHHDDADDREHYELPDGVHGQLRRAGSIAASTDI